MDEIETNPEVAEQPVEETVVTPMEKPVEEIVVDDEATAENIAE